MYFIVAPLIVWICVSGVYSLFELYARRKERMYLCERLGDRLDAEAFKGKIGLPLFVRPSFPSFPSFNGLKIGCLLVGVGLGLTVGLILNIQLILSGPELDGWKPHQLWNLRQLIGVAYGAPVTLFGGLGLIIAFLIEKKTTKQNRD
ncbi:MAG: hypothetical protein LBK22_01705 [Tannerella sp.]|jgi:hypothetical protein|nr:hypothetical protein [Tannerella sp.]